VVAGVLGVSGSAFADPPPAGSAQTVPQTVSVEVMVLHATNGRAASIDPRIDEGKPAQPADNLPSHKLKVPPFTAYNTYVLKDKSTVQLNKGTPQHVTLPNGRTLELSVVNVATVRNEKRYTVAASITQPTGDTYMKLIEFTASLNQSMFVGGISFPTGSLVVAFTPVEPKR
jgi:hypothetical protein